MGDDMTRLTVDKQVPGYWRVTLDHPPINEQRFDKRIRGSLQVRARAPRAAHSLRTGLTSVPSPSISTSTVSPPRRKRPWIAPTPAGVPVAIMSPGSKVMVRESHAISSAGLKIRLAVVPC